MSAAVIDRLTHWSHKRELEHLLDVLDDLASIVDDLAALVAETHERGAQVEVTAAEKAGRAEFLLIQLEADIKQRIEGLQ